MVPSNQEAEFILTIKTEEISKSLHLRHYNRYKHDLMFEMIDLDGCDNNMTNIILATIRDTDEQCNDFRKAGRSREL